MSVKKDPSGRRSVQVEVEVEVPGTPEQVWAAIATGPGISSWFVPTEVDGRAGGKIACDFGGGMLMATLQAYLYGDAADAAARDQPQWQAWLGGLFPAQAAPAAEG